MDLILGILECIRGPSAEIYLEKSYGPIPATHSADDIADEEIQSEKYGLYAESNVEKSYGTFNSTNSVEDIADELNRTTQTSEMCGLTAERVENTLNLGDINMVNEVIEMIQTSEKWDPALRSRIEDMFDELGWTDDIAKAILFKLLQIIQHGQKDIGTGLRDAIEFTSSIVNEFFEFAKDHPEATAVFCTLVAIGVLVFVAPWVIEAVGFGELGPIEGKSIEII